MPFYYGSRARSVPEYLRCARPRETRGLNAITFAVMTVFRHGSPCMPWPKLILILHIFDAPGSRRWDYRHTWILFHFSLADFPRWWYWLTFLLGWTD